MLLRNAAPADRHVVHRRVLRRRRSRAPGSRSSASLPAATMGASQTEADRGDREDDEHDIAAPTKPPPQAAATLAPLPAMSSPRGRVEGCRSGEVSRTCSGDHLRIPSRRPEEATVADREASGVAAARCRPGERRPRALQYHGGWVEDGGRFAFCLGLGRLVPTLFTRIAGDAPIVRQALVTGAAGFIGCHLVEALPPPAPRSSARQRTLRRLESRAGAVRTASRAISPS